MDLLLLAALTLSLRPAAPPADVRDPGGIAVIAVGGDVDAFNEYVATSTLSLDLADQLFLGLMEEKPARPGEPPAFGPRLARSWQVASDGLAVTFDLRDDVVWSDGRPTTAEDVRFTWRVQTDPALGWPDADLKKNIADVKVESPHRVTFALKRRSPYFLLDINEGHILPRHALESMPPGTWRTTDFSKSLVTNGPFLLASWKPGQSIELARNPRYYEKGLPRLGRVIFRVVPDPSIRLQQLLAGETDVLEAPAPESTPRIQSDPALDLVRFDQRMYTYICWNLRRDLFADARVRRALTMALDRAEMLRVLARGMGRPSAGPIVSSVWAASRSLAPPPFDPAASRRLLEEAGWKDRDGDGLLDKEGRPFRFDLEFNQGNTLRENIALRASAQLADVGIKAVPRAVEWAAFQKAHRDGAFDAFVGSRITSTRVDLDSYTTGAPLNYSGYGDAELDRLVARAAAAGTLEEARPLWEQAQEIVARDQPVTFLFEQDRLYAVRRRLHDLEPGPLGILGGLRMWSVAPPDGASAAGPATPPPR